VGTFSGHGHELQSGGLASVDAFVAAHQESAGKQLTAFFEFHPHNKMLDLLKQQNWEAFARHYNGPVYKRK
jgi:hypothetical protein